VNAGELRHRVKLQSVARTSDGAGGFTEAWSDDAEVWAKVEPLQGTQYVLADALRNEVTHRVTIRYRAGVTPRQRVLLASRVLEILTIIDRDEAHVYLQLLCREAV